MVIAVLVGCGLVFLGLWFVAERLGSIQRTLLVATSELHRLAKVHGTIRRAIAPKRSELWDDEVYGETDDTDDKNEPVRFLRELHEIVRTNERIVAALEQNSETRGQHGEEDETWEEEDDVQQ